MVEILWLHRSTDLWSFLQSGFRCIKNWPHCSVLYAVGVCDVVTRLEIQRENVVTRACTRTAHSQRCRSFFFTRSGQWNIDLVTWLFFKAIIPFSDFFQKITLQHCSQWLAKIAVTSFCDRPKRWFLLLSGPNKLCACVKASGGHFEQTL